MAVSLFRTENKVKPIEAHRPTLSKQELESVLDCLINEQLGPGRIVQRFEKTFAGTFQYKNVLAVNSLAAAYHLAFLALEIGPIPRDHGCPNRRGRPGDESVAQSELSAILMPPQP